VTGGGDFNLPTLTLHPDYSPPPPRTGGAAKSGTQIRLSLRASPVSSALVDRIYVWQADPTAGVRRLVMDGRAAK